MCQRGKLELLCAGSDDVCEVIEDAEVPCDAVMETWPIENRRKCSVVTVSKKTIRSTDYWLPDGTVGEKFCNKCHQEREEEINAARTKDMAEGQAAKRAAMGQGPSRGGKGAQ